MIPVQLGGVLTENSVNVLVYSLLEKGKEPTQQSQHLKCLISHPETN